MSGKKLIRQEEVGMVEGQRQGTALMVAGKTLLWMDLIPLIFVVSGFRGGSYLWFWWLIIEGAVGLALLGIGWHKRGSLTQLPR